MAILHPSHLHRQARERLGRSVHNPKRLVLIHTAVSLGASLLLTLFSYLFDRLIADTNGLDSIGARAGLETAQSVLTLGVLILLPFWEIGLAYMALGWAKGETASQWDLTEGFRRWAPVLGYRVLSGLIFMALLFVLLYPCTVLFMLTPWATPLLEIYTPILESAQTMEEIQAALTPEIMEQMTQYMTPLFVILGGAYLLVAGWFGYRLRFGDFALMEGEGVGRALLTSLRATRRNCLQILKVDLHFWWFYLLQLLSVGICYGDDLLSAAGIELPMEPNLRFFCFYVAGILLQLVLFWQFGGERITAYALAYDACKEECTM